MKIICFEFLLCVALFFVSSCGLETFQEIDPPRNAVQPNQADGDTDSGFVESIESQQFEFTAVDLSSTFISPGTDVYYRIYNNIGELQTDAQRINDANTENTSNGFNRLESLGYVSLSSLPSAIPLINKDGGRVIIRLVTDTDGATYTREISVTGVVRATPQRYDNGNFNFDLDTPEGSTLYDDLPKDGDNDYDEGANDGNSKWYVNAYAVSTGLDSTTFSPVTSEVLSLGFIVYSQEKRP